MIFILLVVLYILLMIVEIIVMKGLSSDSLVQRRKFHRLHRISSLLRLIVLSLMLIAFIWSVLL